MQILEIPTEKLIVTRFLSLEAAESVTQYCNLRDLYQLDVTQLESLFDPLESGRCLTGCGPALMHSALLPVFGPAQTIQICLDPETRRKAGSRADFLRDNVSLPWRNFGDKPDICIPADLPVAILETDEYDETLQHVGFWRPEILDLVGPENITRVDPQVAGFLRSVQDAYKIDIMRQLSSEEILAMSVQGLELFLEIQTALLVQRLRTSQTGLIN